MSPWASLPQPFLVCVSRWREGKFQEVVEAEFVLLEVNGLFTYTYSLTAGAALCSSQPQNWTTIMENAGDKGPFAWDREVVVTLRLFPNQVTSQMVTADCTLLGVSSIWPAVTDNRDWGVTNNPHLFLTILEA